MINMIEPTDPKERKAAIKICRANARLHIQTGLPIDRESANEQWLSLTHSPDFDLPYAKWIWMWNNAESEWRPDSGDAVTGNEG